MSIHVQQFRECKDDAEVILLITGEHHTKLTKLAKRKKVKLDTLIAGALRFLCDKV